MLWIVLFIVSGACLLQLQTEPSARLASGVQYSGPGGSFGYFFGKKFLLTTMGEVGSMILLIAVYVSALILMTGLRPIHLVRESIAGAHRGWSSFSRMAIAAARCGGPTLKDRLRSVSESWKNSGAPLKSS